MSVFLTPDGRPFMAGTYYPPTDRHGQVSFSRLLRAMTDAWSHQRPAVEEQAEQLLLAMDRDVSFVDHLSHDAAPFDLAEVPDTIARRISSRCDEMGGFGGAPKFPRPSYVEALIDFDDVEARNAVEQTLDAIAGG